VEVAVLEHGAMEAVLKASANLEAESQVTVVSEAARRVQAILVEEGDLVMKGQLLLRLQDDEQRSQVARVKSQLDKAQREFDRQTGLHGRGLATDAALNDATFELDQQRIGFEDAKRELSYTEVRAPIDGTVTSRQVNIGNQVQVGQALFELIDFESLVARVFIPEKNLREVAVGQKARVHASAVNVAPYEGTILRIAPVVDPRSGTVKVTVAVGGKPGLRPGLYVDVELITAVNPTALCLPKRALIYDNDQIFAFKLGQDRLVEKLQVIPRLANREFVEPVSGFAQGDSVVIAGQAALKNGARVELVQTTVQTSESVPQ
jgi:membrane fusion protein (multidrug efflux system)